MIIEGKKLKCYKHKCYGWIDSKMHENDLMTVVRYLENTADTKACSTAPLGDTTVLSALRAASNT